MHVLDKSVEIVELVLERLSVLVFTLKAFTNLVVDYLAVADELVERHLRQLIQIWLVTALLVEEGQTQDVASLK